MKKLILTLLINIFWLNIFAQFECMVDTTGMYLFEKRIKDGNLCNQTINYIPDATTPIKYIRVNIHFMLTNNGTDNFNETNDGLGNSNYTGYGLC